MKNIKKQLIVLRLLLTRNPIKRANYLKKKNIFKEFGDDCWYQPIKIPTQPKLIKIGNNVKIATEVLFMEHDIIHNMFNKKNQTDIFREKLGTIVIEDNVFIGARSIILYNTKIGKNCVIAAGSVVTHDIPENCIAGGVPAKVIGNINDLEKKYEKYSLKYSDYNLHDDEVLEKLFWKDN